MISFRVAIAAVLLSSVVAFFPGDNLTSAEPPPRIADEYDLKLSQIYLTAKYTNWPDEPSRKPFVIGIVSPGPLLKNAKTLEKRQLRKRAIQIISINKIQDFQSCDLVFIPRNAKEDLVTDVMKLTDGRPVLIWRDEDAPKPEKGIACTFSRHQDEEMLIEVDPAEFKRRNLVPDGQLMNLTIMKTVKPTK